MFGKKEEILTEENNSVELVEETTEPELELADEPIYEPINSDYSDDAKRFSDKFGDKSALDVILELDKKVDEIWRKIF